MSPQQQFIAFKTILIKEFLRFIRIWLQTVLPPMVTTALYFVIFGNLIGERIGDMDGYRYVDFIVPGLILMAVITNSYANGVSSFFQAKYQRHIEELLVSPTPTWVIVTGYMSGGIARGLVVGVAVTAVAMLFSDLHVHNLAVLLSIVVLTSALFSLAGIINGIYAKTFDDVTIIPNFVLTPLTYLGGIFYSITLLPAFWQKVSLLNPILYMINGFRYGFLGVSDIGLATSYVLIIGFTLALFLLALRLVDKGHGVRH